MDGEEKVCWRSSLWIYTSVNVAIYTVKSSFPQIKLNKSAVLRYLTNCILPPSEAVASAGLSEAIPLKTAYLSTADGIFVPESGTSIGGALNKRRQVNTKFWIPLYEICKWVWSHYIWHETNLWWQENVPLLMAEHGTEPFQTKEQNQTQVCYTNVLAHDIYETMLPKGIFRIMDWVGEISNAYIHSALS